MGTACHARHSRSGGRSFLHSAHVALFPKSSRGNSSAPKKLHVLAWLDFDVIKAGELIAFTALELALKDRYGLQVKRRQRKSLFSDLLIHMATVDGLDESKVPMNQRCGPASKVIARSTEGIKPSLADHLAQLPQFVCVRIFLSDFCVCSRRGSRADRRVLRRILAGKRGKRGCSANRLGLLRRAGRCEFG